MLSLGFIFGFMKIDRTGTKELISISTTPNLIGMVIHIRMVLEELFEGLDKWVHK